MGELWTCLPLSVIFWTEVSAKMSVSILYAMWWSGELIYKIHIKPLTAAYICTLYAVEFKAILNLCTDNL